MLDNKYLYFKNLLYVYNTLGYDKMSFYDKEIIIITVIEILTNDFRLNLGYVLQNFMSFYNLPYIKTIEMKNNTHISSLKDLCIYKIKRYNINYTIFNKYIQNMIKKPIFSNKDTNTYIIKYFVILHKNDKKSLIDFLINIYDLPRICDILRPLPSP